jgi:site-specific recombinase XerD
VPSSDGKTPAILGIAGRLFPLTPTAIYQIVKDAFRHVADTLQKEDGAKATRVRRASTHWLRHTAATHQAEDGTPIHHIQQNLRHSSIGTTSIYIHAEEDARHASTTKTRNEATALQGDAP